MVCSLLFSYILFSKIILKIYFTLFGNNFETVTIEDRKWGERMIEVHHETLNNIPYLHIVKAGEKDKKQPLVMFLHGFTSAKEHNLHFAYSLAEKGIRTLLPEAIYHGERKGDMTDKERTLRFWEIVTTSIKEIDELQKHFVAQNLVANNQIGLVGTSMGGITTFGALTQYSWIKTAVSLMGTPDYEQFAKRQIDTIKNSGIDLPLTEEELDAQVKALEPFDLNKHPQLLQNRPLFIWHGKKDDLVPFKLTNAFYEKLTNAQYQGELEFMVEEHTDHKVSREAYLRTVEWFDKQLNK